MQKELVIGTRAFYHTWRNAEHDCSLVVTLTIINLFTREEETGCRRLVGTLFGINLIR
jgi:hypothetical protein